MKSSIIFLGLVALSFTNANAAANFKSQDLDQQEFATLNVENTQSQNQLVFNQEISNTEESTDNDTIVFDPKTVVKVINVRTAEERIAEDKLITESKEEQFQPLSLGFTQKDRIEEDNQIIESTISNEFFPLDFEKINQNVKCIIYNNNALKVNDLKL
jgi:predicted acylesterase/phospholipase RssA